MNYEFLRDFVWADISMLYTVHKARIEIVDAQLLWGDILIKADFGLFVKAYDMIAKIFSMESDVEYSLSKLYKLVFNRHLIEHHGLDCVIDSLNSLKLKVLESEDVLNAYCAASDEIWGLIGDIVTHIKFYFDKVTQLHEGTLFFFEDDDLRDVMTGIIKAAKKHGRN